MHCHVQHHLDSFASNVLGLMLPISTAGSQGVKLSKTCSFSGMMGSSKLQLPLEL